MLPKRKRLIVSEPLFLALWKRTKPQGTQWAREHPEPNPNDRIEIDFIHDRVSMIGREPLEFRDIPSDEMRELLDEVAYKYTTLAEKSLHWELQVATKKPMAKDWKVLSETDAKVLFKQQDRFDNLRMRLSGILADMERLLNNGLIWEEAEVAWIRAGLRDKPIFRVQKKMTLSR